MLSVGDKAPKFKLATYDDEVIALDDYAGKTVVLYFYPKDMTPGCTQQACDFRDASSRLKKAGAVVLGVSKDSSERHVAFRDKYQLSFPLLADTEGKVCEKYGVWKEKSLYGRKFMGIVRTTFLIGPTGKIAAIFPKVKVKGHVDDVLGAISKLKA